LAGTLRRPCRVLAGDRAGGDESPTTPVCTRCRVRTPLRSTVTIPPWTAWFGTTRPEARPVTMSAVALIPAFTPGALWSRTTVAG
jgi:hypothetical protein